MSETQTPGERIIEGMTEAVAVANGEVPAARLHINGHTYVPLVVDTEVKALAQSYLDKADEDWTYVDPEDIKRLARAVLGMTE